MLAKLLRRKSARRAPLGPPGARAYAVGDVHGRLDLLNEMITRIQADNASRGPAKIWLVFLGDLVDRGPDSCGVIDRLAQEPPAFAHSVFIQGNHEEFFLGVLRGDMSIVEHWLSYGGAECAQSYGVTSGWMLNATPLEIIDRLINQVPRSHVEFLEGMCDSFRFGDYLFVHAGIRPGIELDRQTAKDLRWIREGFLDDTTDHGVLVVHGHTIVERAEEHPNRIAIDTGAYRSGTLTCLGIEGDRHWFLTASDG